MTIVRDVVRDIDRTDVRSIGAGISENLYPQDNAASSPGYVDDKGDWTAIGGSGVFTSAPANTDAKSILILVFGADGGASFDLNTILNAGNNYKLSFYLAHRSTGGTGDISTYLSTTTTSRDTILNTLSDGESAFVKVTKTFTHSAATRYFVVQENSAANNGGAYLDTIFITKA